MLEELIPEDHLQRSSYLIPNVDGLRAYFVPIHYYFGRPSIDPASMIRMLFIGYCVGIRSDRWLQPIKSVNLSLVLQQIEP